MFRKRGKKAQAAMEFLMTYGWAILIILIALGVLFYLGVFSPKVSNNCIASAPLTCTDIKADSVLATDEIKVALGAVGVDLATLKKATVTVNTPINVVCNAGADITLSTSTIRTETISCTSNVITKGAKFSGSFDVDYTLQGSTISHTSKITFSGTVE